MPEQSVRITAAGADHLFAYNDAGFLSGYTAPQSSADSLLCSAGRRPTRRSLPDAFRHAGNALFARSKVQYDPDGRIIAEDETMLGEPTHRQYSYDGSGRLENVWEDDELVEHFAFDTHGNRIVGL